MPRTTARRIPVVSGRLPIYRPDKDKQPVKLRRPKRMGFDWGGGTAPERKVGDDWRDTLGWPWSSGGSLGWGSSRGGSLSAGSGSGRASVGLGYHPDLPDHRDYDLRSKDDIEEHVKESLAQIKERNAAAANRKLDKGKSEKKPASFKSAILGETTVPESHDLRWTGSFSPIEDQGEIGSCTAQAVVGLIEYLMIEGGVKPRDMSRMFLYHVTRNLLGWTGDTGAYIRSTIKAMTLFGTPPEHEWPYDISLLDTEPEGYHYSFAQNFKALAYARLDRSDDTAKTLEMLRRTLYDGFPVAFGFPVYSSINALYENDYVVPFPTRSTSLLGGHAVLAVGYDDRKKSPMDGDEGAIIFRNSWGAGWGEAGYGYLPYSYLTEGLANDFWTIFNREWIDDSKFE